MDKLGVVLDEEKTKTAGTKKVCPECGADLSADNSKTDWCPNCGTKPFEKQPEEK